MKLIRGTIMYDSPGLYSHQILATVRDSKTRRFFSEGLDDLTVTPHIYAVKPKIKSWPPVALHFHMG